MTASAAEISRLMSRAGAYACGFCVAEPVCDADIEALNWWVGAGNHADMDWMTRNSDIRRDPRLLLDGAQTLIVSIFNYHAPEVAPQTEHARIASYARVRDYHIVLRERLATVAEAIRARYGGECRICIDSAPLRERYWAQRAGLGYCARNGQLTVPGAGAAFFIATILWTGTVDIYSEPYSGPGCGNCRRCVDACPTGALHGDGTLDCRRCLSYLTIESHSDIPADINPDGNMFGCDTCRLACPHSHNAPATAVTEFRTPHPAALLTPEEWLKTGTSAFRRITSGSPLSRVRLAHLKSVIRRLEIPGKGQTGTPHD